MASYYYLIASLPMLRPNEEPPLDYPAFLELCKTAVSAGVYAQLEQLSEHSDAAGLLHEWAAFHQILTAELNHQRCIRLGRPGVPPSTRDPGVSEAVSAALAAKHPLEAEQILLRLQFSRLDSMIGLHNFDEYALYGYAMKLKLLQRQRMFRYEPGRAAFQGLLDTIQQQIFSI